DQSIVPDANIVFGGAGANRTVTITPAADANGGPVTITFTVTDLDTDSTPTQFTITVNAVNDAPSFTASDPPTTDEDAPNAVTVNGWVTAFDPGPADESGQLVSGYTVSNVSNTALFSVQPAVDASGNLTYTVASGANGVSTFDVTVTDDGGGANDTSAPQTFTITVNAVNGPVVSLPGATVDYVDNSAATLIDTGGAVTSAAADFNSGSLTVTIITNGDAADLLTIRDSGTPGTGIEVSGAVVTYDGDQIGSFAGGTSGNPLVITFDMAFATPTAVTALIQAIEFFTDAGTFNTRTIRFTVDDGDGFTGSDEQNVNVTTP
ncbi:MAG: Ig-like domain-containing protein, partial [Planctomycetota bacterium]